MRIDIITVLPEMIEGFVHESILARAQKKGLAEIHLHNLRDYSTDKWRRVDDYPYGGFAGMVMQCEPIDRAISALKAERDYDEVIFTSPDGEQFDQHLANELSMKGNLIILCGHYKGIDQRVRDHLITREISIGDYVLTGGELAAAVMADAIVRLVPGVISDDQSALSDCFQDDMLSAPIYTRPADYKGWKVPDILLSGNEAKIKDWEIEQSFGPLSRAGVRLHLGKGKISDSTVRILEENNSVYAVIPPVTALLENNILERRLVAFPELGMEAFYELTVREYPAIIAAAHGASIY